MSRTKLGSIVFRSNPDTPELAQKVTYALFNSPDTELDAITELVFTRPTGGFDLSRLPLNLEVLTAPHLVTVPAPNYIAVAHLDSLHTIGLPLLATACGIEILSNAALTSAVFLNLATTPDPTTQWEIRNNPALATLVFPSLATPPHNLNFDGNALSEDSVNNLLVQLAGLAWAAPDRAVKVNAGTSHAPTGAGAAAKAAMIAAGATVTTN